MISVCLRFDDPSPCSIRAIEHGIIDVLRKHEISACFAVVPYKYSNTGELIGWTEESAAHLIDAEKAGLIEIAQHGYTHQAISAANDGTPSEFCGVSKTDQMRSIEQGLKHMKQAFGDNIKGFVPPWNTYDSHTLDAVANAGLGFLSASRNIIHHPHVPVIPRSSSLKTAEEHLGQALRYDKLDPIVCIVFHPDEFEEYPFPPAGDEPPQHTNLREFDKLISRIKADGNYTFDSLSQLARESRPPRFIGDPPLVRFIPWRIRRRYPSTLVVRAPANLRTLFQLAQGQAWL